MKNREFQLEACRQIIGSTNHKLDRYKCLIAIRYAESVGIYGEVLEMILKSRFNYLNWLSNGQRYWQKKTKNPNKAKHHDSIEIREKYVRCQL